MTLSEGYTNSSASPRYARLHVNGAVGTWIEFPPTAKQASAVWIEAKLNPHSAANTLAFFAGCHPGPRILSIEVH